MLKINLKSILLVLVGVVFAIGTYAYAASTFSVLKDPNGEPAKNGAVCTVGTQAPVTVGHQQATKILATSTTRAWARIAVVNNATTTAWLAFNDVSAVANRGVGLNLANANGASTTPELDFGITTDFPYNGAVSAITNFGSTTLMVTECNY